MCKSDLHLENKNIIADIVEVLWKTLDYANTRDRIDGGGAAVHGRFTFLQAKLVELFSEKKIDKNQVRAILEYC